MLITTPNRSVSKAPRPQGSSPMARNSEVEDLDLSDLDLNLDDNEDKDAFPDNEDADSISRRIASTRKHLFKASGGRQLMAIQQGARSQRIARKGNQKHGRLLLHR